jgi:polyisoprenoid-binding protein YceI
MSMQSRLVALFLALGMSLALGPLVSAQSVSQDPSHAPTGAYQLETAHSQLLFSVLHIGLTDYYGRFDKLSGTLSFDSHQPEKSSVSITIDMSSIDTPSKELERELTGSSFFDTKQFATANFKSTSITRTGPNTGRIAGDLTLKNVTKPVTLDVTFNGGEKNPMNDAYALGFRGTATIKRSDFGLTGMIWEPFLSNDDVQLIIEAMFQHKKD